MGKGLRELATKEKLSGKSDRALTVTTINELQKYYRRAIVNNTCHLKSMPNDIQANFTTVRWQTKDPTAADVQRVHYHGIVLIKENESDQRESIGNPKDQRSFIEQTK